MKMLLIINDAPYGSEKAYNALRLALTLRKEHSDIAVQIFLMADAVPGALPCELNLIDGIELSTMSQLAAWVAESDKVLTF